MSIRVIQNSEIGKSSRLTDVEFPEIYNEEDYKKTEEIYRSLIETSPDAIIMVDISWMINMCNRQFLKMVGFDEIEEILNTSVLDYFLKKERQFFIKDVEYVLRVGIITNMNYTLRTSKGKKIPVEINASIILDSLGKIIGIIFIIRDITDRKAAERALINSEVRFRSVWENSNDGMRLTDGNGIIVEVNNSYCELTGIKRRDLIGRFFYEVYSDDSAIDKDELLKKYKESFAHRSIKKYSNSRYKYQGGEELELNETYSFIDFGKDNTLVLGIFHNITEMRKAEEELKTSEKFVNIGKQAAILTHEIKTPLASIKTNIDMLYKNLSTPESNQKSLRIVQKEIKRLVKLLKNVLLYSKEIDLTITPIDLGYMFENIKDFMRPLMNESHIVMHNNVTDVKIMGDYKNLQTVFMHMIENSIESMNGGGLIEIYSEVREDGNFIFIKDNGCGIKDKEEIFQPFYTTKSTGTGLGLAIANNILKEHNSELTLLKSVPGETIFQIKFLKDQE